MSLRLARPDDADGVRDIYAPFVAETAVSFEESVPGVDAIADRIESTVEQYPWLVCVAEDAESHDDPESILGYAYAGAHRNRAAYRWSVDTSVYVAESARRQNVATGLYTALFEVLRAQNYVNAYAGTTLPNPGSVGFHTAMGFEPVGTYEAVGYKDGEWHDVQWLVRRLRNRPANPEEPLPVGEIVGTDASESALGAGEDRLDG